MARRAECIRADFPFFSQPDAPVYLDSAATAQKPRCVIDRITAYYTVENANIHRGSYPLANRATRAYEQARADIASFIGASAGQVTFTMNATDALNQAASIVAAARIRSGDNVIATAMEHHSALLPFMRACQERGAELRLIPIGEGGVPRLEQMEGMIDAHTAAAVITAGSNSTGWRTPLETVLPILKDRRIPVVLDATQRIVHERMDFAALGCDFLCFSGHKLYGPMGIGVLAMKEEWAQTGLGRVGGGMVRAVAEDGFERARGIQALEAGTPPVAQALGLQSAVHYLIENDPDALFAREAALVRRLIDGLDAIPGIRVLPAGEDRLPIAAFVSEYLHPSDMAQLLGMRGIALRCGQHCAHIAHRQLGVEATLRASIGIYTSAEDIDALLDAVRQLQRRGGKGSWKTKG